MQYGMTSWLPPMCRGNIVGQSPYTTGNESCSACPDAKPYCDNNLCSE